MPLQIDLAPLIRQLIEDGVPADKATAAIEKWFADHPVEVAALVEQVKATHDHNPSSIGYAWNPPDEKPESTKRDRFKETGKR